MSKQSFMICCAVILASVVVLGLRVFEEIAKGPVKQCYFIRDSQRDLGPNTLVVLQQLEYDRKNVFWSKVNYSLPSREAALRFIKDNKLEECRR